MTAYERETHAKLQKLESIDARLAQHEKMARFGMMWLSTIGITALALMVYIITRL